MVVIVYLLMEEESQLNTPLPVSPIFVTIPNVMQSHCPDAQAYAGGYHACRLSLCKNDVRYVKSP